MNPSNIDPTTITPEMLGTLLVSIFCPKTEVIKESTRVLKSYFKLRECIGPLLSYATGSPDVRVRLLACICLKKRVTKHWPAQEAAFKVSVKETLLSAFLSETDAKVRENIAYVIGTLASLLIPSNEWPEIFALITAKCQSSNPLELDQGVLLLYAICDELGKGLEPFISPIIELLNKLIAIKANQTLTVKTINAILSSNISEDSLVKVIALLPHVLEMTLASPDNASLLHEIFDSFSDLVYIPKLLVPYLPTLIEVALSIAENKDNSNDLRNIVLAFIEFAVNTKAKLIRKDKKMLTRIVDAAFKIATENEDEHEEDEETPVTSALYLLQAYALKIPNKIIYPLIMERCDAFIKSPEPRLRKAALMILGATCKGIELALKKNLDSVLDVALKCAKDESVEVQEACFKTLYDFADCIPQKFSKHYPKVLPVLLAEMASKPDPLKIKILIVLETFCEHLSKEEISPYLKPLLQLLIFYVDSLQMYRTGNL